MKASFIVFPEAVACLLPSGVSFSATEFSEAEGWSIEVVSPQRVVLSRQGNAAENIPAVPAFSVNGCRFSASDVEVTNATRVQSAAIRVQSAGDTADAGKGKRAQRIGRKADAERAEEPTPKDAALDGLLK